MAQQDSDRDFDDIHLDMGDDSAQSTRDSKNPGDDIFSAMSASLGQKVAENVLEAGATSARKFAASYSRLELLQPYFDVEPSDVRRRLLRSLVPTFSRQPQVMEADMYGPLMLALTMVAVLLLNMKHLGHSPAADSTIIGTAFAVVFGFWITSFGILYAVTFVFNTEISVVELLAATGYNMTGFILVLLASHLTLDATAFFVAWLTLGILSCMRLGLLLRSRTPDAKQGFLIFIVASSFSWLYLGYIHYMYNKH